jgi:hypothetical protein
MLKFIDTTTAIRFVSTLDTDENKTTFLITPLNSQEVQVINDATVSIKSTGTASLVDVKQTARNRYFAQLGLRGFENAGKEFVTEHKSILGLPKKDIIIDEILNAIPIDYVNELGEKIAELSLSTGIPVKN